MHTLFLLSALLLALLISVLGAGLLRVLAVGSRQPSALAVLGLPIVVLLLAVSHLIPLFWQECAPLVGWDRWASFGLLGVLAAIGLAAVGLNVGRLVLVGRLLPVCTPLSESDLRLGDIPLGSKLVPGVRVLQSATPLAAAGGIWRPSIVLSTWIIEHLEPDEFESVLTHELAHLARRDYLLRWVARLLRDATIYLPGGWYALNVLEADQELGADAMAVAATGRPLAMASALGKVWRALDRSEPVQFAGMPNYAATSAALLEERLHRLLDGTAEPSSPLPGRLLAGASVVSASGIALRVLALSAAALPLMCTMRY